MNQHVDRRQLVAGTAFAAIASSSTAFARPVNPASSVSEPDPALLTLEAKFMAEWENMLAIQTEHNAAERRFFDALPERPIEPEPTDEERALFAEMRVADFEDKTHPHNVLSAQRRREFKERKAAYDAERQDIEQRTGYAKMDRAYTRQMFRAGRAADKVLFHPAQSLADLAVKARVHKIWDYESEKAAKALFADVTRLSKNERKARAPKAS